MRQCVLFARSREPPALEAEHARTHTHSRIQVTRLAEDEEAARERLGVGGRLRVRGKREHPIREKKSELRSLPPAATEHP